MPGACKYSRAKLSEIMQKPFYISIFRLHAVLVFRVHARTIYKSFFVVFDTIGKNNDLLARIQTDRLSTVVTRSDQYNTFHLGYSTNAYCDNYRHRQVDRMSF